MLLRRVRVLIYEGDDKWMSAMREREWIKDGTSQHLPNGCTISSLESTVLVPDQEVTSAE